MHHFNYVPVPPFYESPKRKNPVKTLVIEGATLSYANYFMVVSLNEQDPLLLNETTLNHLYANVYIMTSSYFLKHHYIFRFNITNASKYDHTRITSVDPQVAVAL